MNYSDEASFNMALLYSQGIYTLLRKISDSFIRLDLHETFMCLRGLYREICCKLKADERKHVERLFADVQKLLRQDQILKKKISKISEVSFYDEVEKPTNELKLNQGRIYKALEKIDITLRDYLEAKKMLIPNKSDRSHLRNLEE